MVEDGATIGANATVRCGARIGRGAFVAAGAVVLEDVPACTMVAGVPARAIGISCLCGERVSAAALSCASCGRSYVAVAGGFEVVGEES